MNWYSEKNIAVFLQHNSHSYVEKRTKDVYEYTESKIGRHNNHPLVSKLYINYLSWLLRMLEALNLVIGTAQEITETPPRS